MLYFALSFEPSVSLYICHGNCSKPQVSLIFYAIDNIIHCDRYMRMQSYGGYLPRLALPNHKEQ